MNIFGRTSKARLSTCHPQLQAVFNEVIKGWDCSILCGERPEEDQNEAYSSGRSTVQYPNSKHNTSPSLAVDVAPYPIDWDDLGRFYMFAGYVMRIAEDMNIKIRYGGDWDGDKHTTDHKFKDLPHWELVL